MEKDFFLKIAKILIGFGLIIKGIDFVNQSLYFHKELLEFEKHPNISVIVNTIGNPTVFLLTGIYLIILGLTLVYFWRFFLKTLIFYSLMISAYYIFFDLLFSIVNFQINISLDFVNKIFMLLGMIYVTIQICYFNGIDCMYIIKKQYKLSIVLGVLLVIIQFIYNYYRAFLY